MNNKAIQILKTFSKEDVRRFHDFLSSPFFNQSKKLIKFYDALIRFYPEFDSKFLSEKALSKKTCPELPFNRLTVNSLFFDLSKAAEKYFLIISVEKCSVESDDLLRRELFERKLYKLMSENIKNTKNRITENKNVNANFYVNMFNLLTDTFNLNKINNPNSSESKIQFKVDILTQRGKFILYFFITEMIREYENLLTIEKAYNTNEDSNFIFKFFSKVDFTSIIQTLIENNEDDIHSKIIRTYLGLFLAFSHFDDEKYYFEYKKILLKNMDFLSVDEKRFHFGRLLRYCLVKTEKNELNSKFNNELFNIYEFILKSENYKSSIMHFMPMELYRGILSHGLKLKKYKWVLDFIKTYSKLLLPDRRKNILYFSLAEYFFRKRMFKGAKKNLSKIVFEEFIYKTDYKNLLLMIHVELKEYENALCMIDSYNHFLSNDKTLSKDYKKRLKKFINVVQKLVLHKTSANNISSYYIEKEFDGDFPYKDWLNDKITEESKGLRKAV